MSNANQYEVTATAIRQAEDALKTLKDFSEIQYKVKGNTMMEQITNYVFTALSNAKYLCSSFKYRRLALSDAVEYFVFYIYDNTSAGYPAFIVRKNGTVRKICDFNEWMMLNIVQDWDGFKKELDSAIKNAMADRIKNINSKLSSIGYVNEQLDKWHI